MIKVLIVDDSQTARDVLNSILSYEKDIMVVGLASNGNEAINFLKTTTSQPDVILLDMKMPVMDGMETMEYIMTYMPVPILIVTVLNKDEVLAKAEEFGVYDVVQKPAVNPDEDIFTLQEEIIEKVKKLARGNITI